MQDELKHTLNLLYKLVSSEITISLQENKLNKFQYEYLEAQNLDFKSRHTTFNYDFKNIHYFDFYDWSTDYFIEFLDKRIKPSPEFEAAVNQIQKHFDIPIENVRYIRDIGVAGFVKYIMRNALNGGVNENNIGTCIQTFIDDYNTLKGDNLYTWKIQVWLNNFHIEREELKIDKFVLRKPKLEELHISRPRKAHADEFEQITSRSISSTVILEYSQRAPKQNVGLYSDEIRYEIESCIDVLRLYNVGNVTIHHLSVSPISILEHGHDEMPDSPFDKSWKDKIDYHHTSRYEYLVSKREEKDFIDFFLRMKPLVTKLSPKSYLNGSYLEIAYHRYKDSLLRSEVNVNRLVSAISCLEALLSNTTSEITFKISIHVAALLRHFDFDSVIVLKKMKEAYTVRSLILHGDKLKEKLLAFTNQHTHELVNYARLCLLTSIQLTLSKNTLIEDLDKSLISDSDLKRLKSLISKEVQIPVIYPFRIINEGDKFMTKKIVCIGWGSLIWQPKTFIISGTWNTDGPDLPIEFVRESSGKRITLVIDKLAKPQKTLWALMPTSDISQAIQSLKERENSQKIEFVEATDNTTDEIKSIIRDWLRVKNIDVAIWTGLEAKFNGNPVRPTIDQVISHLATLSGDEKKDAEEYIRRAPDQINTEYRREIVKELGWTNN
jgi:hypothetical protein